MISTHQSAGSSREMLRVPSMVSAGRSQPKFIVRLAEGVSEVQSALWLRSRVFNEELRSAGGMLDIDKYDPAAHHLIVTHRDGQIVGTYRLNTMETAGTAAGFYSAAEFTLGNLPDEIFENGVEIGRACIGKEYRNTKVLFMLWSGLLKFLENNGKRYFFGCCSIFTQDESHGASAYRKLVANGHVHPEIRVMPRRNAVDLNKGMDTPVELPSLFNMYLRLGAKVCGPPMVDRDFGTIDFFVLLDIRDVNEKYRRMFSAV